MNSLSLVSKQIRLIAALKCQGQGVSETQQDIGNASEVRGGDVEKVKHGDGLAYLYLGLISKNSDAMLPRTDRGKWRPSLA
jgi:hypothetical protein